MWHSEDEFLKDLASLKDFGTPEDQESYKILYSVGRGLKTKVKPKAPEKFIDSRTGEAINLEDASLDINTFNKSKGRGSLLGSLFRTKLQLQQQLRLARPLGSGDQAVESYYGRNRSAENIDSSINTQYSKPVAQNSKTTSESQSSELNKSKIIKRVKATRNSSSQVNALINGLLSKQKLDSKASSNQDFVNDVEDELSYSNSSSSVENDIDNKQSDVNDLKISDLAVTIEWNKKGDILKKNIDDFEGSNILDKKYIGDDNFKIIDDDEKEEVKESKLESETKDEENFLKTKNDFVTNGNGNGNDITESENDHDKKYRALGERLNRLRATRSNTVRDSNYDFASHSECYVPKESVIFNDEDFPPLGKS